MRRGRHRFKALPNDWSRLYDRREAWKPGIVPAGGLFLTAGADVQKDRIEIDVWAWGRDVESWLVEHIGIDGGPDHQGTWAELTKLLDRTWPHQNGAQLRLAKLAIDTGYEAPAVYAWSRRQCVAAGFSDGNQGMQVAQFHVLQSHSAVIRSDVRGLHQFNL